MTTGRTTPAPAVENVAEHTMRAFLAIVLFLIISCTSVFAQTYSTNFPVEEDPISEDGHWINGKSVGLDWTDVSATVELAFGRETGLTGYDDATALLAGSWGADQTAQATVFTVNQNDRYFQEVALRLRSSLSAHISTGYEINFRCSKTANAYMEIVRWNGLLGDFTYLLQQHAAQYGVANGDVIKATIIGNVITAYINEVQVARVTDDTFVTGNPGMGIFLRGPASTNRDYGFTRFTATGSLAPPGATVPAAATTGWDGGCFIATAAYRSPFAPEVERLRTVRNRYLLSFGMGRDFVAGYDRATHPLAVRIARSPKLQAVTRLAITPVLAWAGLLLWSPILGATAPVAVLSLTAFSGLAWRRKHRR
jgi:hypothetical protein